MNGMMNVALEILHIHLVMIQLNGNVNMDINGLLLFIQELLVMAVVNVLLKENLFLKLSLVII